MAALRAKLKKKKQMQNLKNWILQFFYNSSRPYGRLLENPKTEDSRELLLPEMISKLDLQ